MKKKTILLLTVLCLLLTGCSFRGSRESMTVTGVYFDTVITIQAWGASDEVMEQCKQICRDFEQRLSPTIESSEISKINQSGGQPVTVSDDTARLIALGLEYGRLTDGAFDITAATAGNLWDFKDRENARIPDGDELKEAAAHIDYRNVSLEGNTITMKDPLSQIDLGGIAKGYIADRLKEYLESAGVKHGLINLGGNMVCLGGRTDGTPFRIGIQEPFAREGDTIGVLLSENSSIVSSGNYERFFTADGTIYHHILSPDTGWPVQNNLYQVTVISDCSADGDALSTACYVLGLEKGLDLIRSIEGTEAVFITSDMEIISTDDSLLQIQ